MPELAKATLQQLKPDFTDPDDDAKDKTVVVQFNPETLKVSYQNQIQQPEGAGDQKGSQSQLFVGAGTTKLTCSLWFDVSAPILTPTGVYVPIGHAKFGKATGRMGGRIVGMLPAFLALLLPALADPKKRKNFKMLSKSEAMATLTALLESGQLTPIVARTFPLGEVPAAMRCLEETREAGRIVITP